MASMFGGLIHQRRLEMRVEDFYLATPPGTLQTSLDTKNDHRLTSLQCSASFSRSKSSPMGSPQPESRISWRCHSLWVAAPLVCQGIGLNENVAGTYANTQSSAGLQLKFALSMDIGARASILRSKESLASRSMFCNSFSCTD